MRWQRSAARAIEGGVFDWNPGRHAHYDAPDRI
jgi:hypothetical protein